MTTTYEDLRERFINGEGNVTAAQLDKARREAEFDNLKAEASEAAAAREAAAQRERELTEVRAKAAAMQTNGVAHLQQAYADLISAGHTLRATLEQRRADISGLNAVLVKHDAAEDLPEEYDAHHYIERALEEIRAGHPIAPHRLHSEG